MYVCIVVENCCLVYAEGGPKGIRKYKRLMTHRIKWDKGEDEDSDVEEESDIEEDTGVTSSGSINRCSLAWEGVVPKRQFRDFRLEICTSSENARKHMKIRGCPQYWDLVLAAH
jgi:U4/U6 small nuclear ribonucleoprotein PRP3